MLDSWKLGVERLELDKVFLLLAKTVIDMLELRNSSG